MADISTQLSEYCNCTEFDDRDLQELISLVSRATCWAEDPSVLVQRGSSACQTFLQGERREVIDLPDCLDCVFEFEPMYRPFVLESFSFTLVEINGIEETSTPITTYSYSTLDGKFRIDLGLPSCGCACTTCGCKPEKKLLVEYVAGYEEIPDCLLPVFCNLLDVIHAKNKCDCNNCGCDSETEDVRYATGDVVTVQVETDLGKMVADLVTGELGLMSVCRIDSGIWAVIE